MKRCSGMLFFMMAGTLAAFPMSTSSVSHYARIEVTASGATIQYALDLAKDPTFQLLQQWGLTAASPREQLESRAAAQAREWTRNLVIQYDGRTVEPRFERATLAITPGAGGASTMRISASLNLPVAPGNLTYEDRNFPDRTGRKEIVIAAGPGASIEQAYPANSTTGTPQELKASVTWVAGAGRVNVSSAPIPKPVAPGTVVRGDFLSGLLQRRDIGFGLILLGMAVAFGLGAVHALSPGHGKTIVAAYLVGTRGTFKHAIFLGGMVTFTHTITVFLLGLTTLFLSQYVLPEKIFPVLGAISGLSIVWIGGMLLYKRARGLHDHNHAHDHHHGPGGHTHLPEGDVTLGSLIALGASGGLVPCPSALVLLLSSIALGRVALGLLLLVAFSTGLAIILMGIGVLVLYAKHLLPDSQKTAAHPAFRIIPVASAAIIVCIGLLMTGVSLGWIQPSRFVG